MGTHTPGPWKWDESYGAIVAGEGPNMLVTPIWKSSPAWGYSENIANARLIAAAPDLLEAVRMVLDAATEDGHELSDSEICHAIDWQQLRAAIAKAEGGEA